MADDETPETPDEETVVVGDVIDTAPDEVTVEGDTNVVVETPAEEGGDSVDAVVIDHAIDTAAQLAAMEARLAAVEDRAFSAEVTADIALDAAEAALEADEEIIAAADEAIVETIEGAEIDEGNPLTDEDDTITVDEIAPVSSRVHPWFRSFSDWRAGRN